MARMESVCTTQLTYSPIVSLPEALQAGIMTKSQAGTQDFYECRVCKRSMTGITPAQSHLEGSRHIKALKNHAHKAVLLASVGSNLFQNSEENNVHSETPARDQPASAPLPVEDLPVSSTEYFSKVGNENLDVLLNCGMVIEMDVAGQTLMTCKVCNVTCTGEVPMKQHLIGESHSKRQRRLILLPNSTPTIAGPLKDLSSKLLTDGFENDDLQVNASLPKDVFETAVEEGIVRSTGEFDSDNLTCTVCATSCTGKVPMLQHLQGGSHQKKLRLKRSELSTSTAQGLTTKDLLSTLQKRARFSVMPSSDVSRGIFSSEIENGIIIPSKDGFRCEVCDISCNGEVPMTAHLSGDQHYKKLRVRSSSASSTTAVETTNNSTENTYWSRFLTPEMQGLTISEAPFQLEIDNGTIIRNTKYFDCVACGISCNSEASMKSHLIGDQHRKKRAQNACVAALQREGSNSSHSSNSPTKVTSDGTKLSSVALEGFIDATSSETDASAFQCIDRLSASPYQMPGNLRGIKIYMSADSVVDLFDE